MGHTTVRPYKCKTDHSLHTRLKRTPWQGPHSHIRHLSAWTLHMRSLETMTRHTSIGVMMFTHAFDTGNAAAT